MPGNNGLVKRYVRLSKLVDIFRVAESLVHPKLHIRVG